MKMLKIAYAIDRLIGTAYGHNLLKDSSLEDESAYGGAAYFAACLVLTRRLVAVGLMTELTSKLRKMMSLDLSRLQIKSAYRCLRRCGLNGPLRSRLGLSSGLTPLMLGRLKPS